MCVKQLVFDLGANFRLQEASGVVLPGQKSMGSSAKSGESANPRLESIPLFMPYVAGAFFVWLITLNV